MFRLKKKTKQGDCIWHYLVCCECVCVCFVCVYVWAVTVLVKTAMYQTSYNDCMTSFREPLLPPYSCKTGLKNHQMTEVQPAPVEDDVPAPPLKKRATKRGLCRMVNAAPADEPATESHNVYSSCVAQSFSNFSRKPLFSKQCNRNTKIPSG